MNKPPPTPLHPLGAAKVILLGDMPILPILYPALVVGASDRRTHEELAPMIRRPLAALASLLLTVLGAVFLLPDCASACTCAIESNPKERVELAVSDSEAVFSGEVVDFEKGADSTIYGPIETVSFRVSEVWKGPERQTMQIGTAPNDGVSCGFPFEEGKEYLVYASGKQDLEASGCSETKPLSEAGADLALLGDGQKPDGSGGEALSDTSGGVSGRGMVGIAVLAMAASLMLVARLMRTG